MQGKILGKCAGDRNRMNDVGTWSVNGRFVNPLSEKFLPGDPVPAARRAEFVAHARQLIARLDTSREPGAPESVAVETPAAGSPAPARQ